MKTMYEKALDAIYEWSRISLLQLLDDGLDVNKSDDDGTTLLMEAALWGTPEILDILLKAGAKVNAQDNEGNVALMYTFNIFNIECLLNMGADFTIKNKDGDDAVIKAFNENQKRIFDLYVEKGAQPDISVDDYVSGVIKYRDKMSDMLEQLYQKGFDVGNLKSKISPCVTLLESAVINNSFSMADILLQNGANPNDTDSLGRTALHYVVMCCSSPLIAYDLIKNGADVNALDKQRSTPLHYTNAVNITSGFNQHIKQDRVRVLNLLLENGANIMQMNSTFNVPFDRIYNSRDVDLVRAICTFMEKYPKYEERLRK